VLWSLSFRSGTGVPWVECVGARDYSKPSLVSFVLRGVSLQVATGESRRIKLCFVNLFYILFKKGFGSKFWVIIEGTLL
jgi:hypothetical protein